jgi:hypothetical protein
MGRLTHSGGFNVHTESTFLVHIRGHLGYFRELVLHGQASRFIRHGLERSNTLVSALRCALASENGTDYPVGEKEMKLERVQRYCNCCAQDVEAFVDDETGDTVCAVCRSYDVTLRMEEVQS